MPLSAEDNQQIADLINQHGHLVDGGELDRIAEILTADAEYDVTDLDGGVLVGPEGLRDAALSLGDANPLAHHVTNIVIEEVDTDTARVHSKGLGLMADGTIGSVTYEDRVERRAVGWRISRRVVRARRTPLTP